MSTDEAARVKGLEQENRALRRANEIVKRAATFSGATKRRVHLDHGDRACVGVGLRLDVLQAMPHAVRYPLDRAAGRPGRASGSLTPAGEEWPPLSCRRPATVRVAEPRPSMHSNR